MADILFSSSVFVKSTGPQAERRLVFFVVGSCRVMHAVPQAGACGKSRPGPARLGGRTFCQERQEQTGEQETGEVVHCEAQFVAVGAGLPRPLRATATNAGIIDEEIEVLRRWCAALRQKRKCRLAKIRRDRCPR